MALIDHLRLIGTPDTNRVMMGELSRLARRALSGPLPQGRKQGLGGVIYPFDIDLAAVAVGYHRTSTRVLWDLYTSRARRLEPLYDELRADVASDTRAWLHPGATISVHARNVAEFAAGPRQLVGTVKNALIEGAAARGVALSVDADDPDLTVAVRMHDHAITVSIDLAGGSRSQRGYRTQQGEAPLREHLAAVLCMLARHDPRAEVLLDPMCGAGTLCIEAALMAQARPVWPPGRVPAMHRMPLLAARLAASGAGREPLFADTAPAIVGSDVDPAAIRAATGNGERAGVARFIRWRRGDFRQLAPADVLADASHPGEARKPNGGLILCNPPYGRRLSTRDTRALYRDLARFCGQFRGWRAGFLVASSDWESSFGLRARIRKPLRNGPISAVFYLYDL